MERITEASSLYRHLEKASIAELLSNINTEDKKVPEAIEGVLPAIAKVVEKVVEAFNAGGRLFYMGAGTSGRLGVLDASECPPTFGVPAEMVVGLIAGGDHALRNSIEDAEDSTEQGFLDLEKHQVSTKDVVVGIAASGTTPYVVNALKKCQEKGIVTACVTCNEGSPMAANADFPIEVVVGPEFVTGSTRMKSGTAQKLVLNMITTASMIKFGRVLDNKMVDMKLANNKLKQRAVNMVVEKLGISEAIASGLLAEHGSVRNAINAYQNG